MVAPATVVPASYGGAMIKTQPPHPYLSHGKDVPKLYTVEVTDTRTAVFWVLAADRHLATLDAEELALTLEEWDTYDLDFDVMAALVEPAATDEVWVGGEKGTFRPWREIR